MKTITGRHNSLFRCFNFGLILTELRAGRQLFSALASRASGIQISLALFAVFCCYRGY